MANTKKLTILHSNDLHGDFMAEHVDDVLVGGVSMLSGYINKVRNENPNTVYLIAGDMFRGSVIDSEYHGASTIDIMNFLGPDVVALGNHELDYGIANLLFLERCAKFPIVNANLYITKTGTRLFQPSKILNVDGMNILFIGIITEAIMDGAKNDRLLGSFVNVEEAALQVGKICNAYKGIDVDLTVLMTHIGFEEDKKLASLLEPEWGVDVIVGGHSHTVIEKPERVGDVLIVQAGTGTDYIGRFDINVNTDTNSVESYDWRLVPINADTCPRDADLEKVIAGYKEETDRKYRRMLTRFTRELTHPDRYMETELGNLFSDMMAESLGLDIAFVGSGSIRTYLLGPFVDYGALCEAFPYNDPVYHLRVTGTTLRKMFLRIFRDEAWEGDHTEFYQVSRGIHVKFKKYTTELLEFTWQGEAIKDDDTFDIGLQKYHFSNLQTFFGITEEEATALRKPRMVCVSPIDLIEEYMLAHPHLDAKVEGRMEIIE